MIRWQFSALRPGATHGPNLSDIPEPPQITRNTTMAAFTFANTEGFDFGQGDLDELNHAIKRIVDANPDPGDLGFVDWFDVEELLLDRYNPSCRFPSDAFDCLVEDLCNREA